MDTSKEYIEMCGKSIKIQNEWKCDVGDYYYDQFSQEVEISVRDISQSIKFQYFTWIPRQDQLQDMVGQWNYAYSLFDCYRCTPLFYVDKRPHFPFNVFGSLEQCWLAFVMNEKYGKRWDGTNWVVE